MKFTLLMASAAAIKLQESPDCPESTQVFPLNERASPVSAGFIQTSFVSGLSQQDAVNEHILDLGENDKVYVAKGFAEGLEG